MVSISIAHDIKIMIQLYCYIINKNNLMQTQEQIVSYHNPLSKSIHSKSCHKGKKTDGEIFRRNQLDNFTVSLTNFQNTFYVSADPIEATSYSDPGLIMCLSILLKFIYLPTYLTYILLIKFVRNKVKYYT